MKQPVTFKNNVNQTLFGILHIPENPHKSGKRIGVNILNPGLKNRVAPNRLNVKIARMLCEKGFYVFRFDPFGIGDSQGYLSEKNENLLDMWRMIQKGAFVLDTIIANSFFIEKCNLDELLLIGQCGAGVTALLSGEKDSRINDLVLIDTPFRIVSSDMDINEIEANFSKPADMIKKGIQSIFNPQKIKKLISLGFDWRLYLMAFTALLRDSLENKRNIKTISINNRFNWKMLKAFISFINRKRKVYFIFAENDFSLKEFNQDFRPNFLDHNVFYLNQCKIDIIKNANHIYTETVWQNELMKNILERFMRN